MVGPFVEAHQLSYWAQSYVTSDANYVPIWDCAR